MDNYKKYKDEEIVELVYNQDKKIYAEIIRRYQEKPRRYIFNIVQDEEKPKANFSINLSTFQKVKLDFGWWQSLRKTNP